MGSWSSHVAVMRKSIASNKLKKRKEESLYQYHHYSYSTPLTSQVEALDTPSVTAHQSLDSLESTADSAKQQEKAVHLNLSPDHINKNSAEWCRNPFRRRSNARQKCGNSKYRRNRLAIPLHMVQSKAAVLDGTVPSGISDTGATSSASHMGDPLIQTSTQSEEKSMAPLGVKLPHLT